MRPKLRGSTRGRVKAPGRRTKETTSIQGRDAHGTGLRVGKGTDAGGGNIEIDAQDPHDKAIAHKHSIDVDVVGRAWRQEYGRDGRSVHLFFKQYHDINGTLQKQVNSGHRLLDSELADVREGAEAVVFQKGDKVQLLDIDLPQKIDHEAILKRREEKAKLKKQKKALKKQGLDTATATADAGLKSGATTTDDDEDLK